ncbi:hypothetical protein ATN84_01290 [Paramesorhizobium deserti]|uniref:DUF4167 domain-containing protein n=2 Tax=Paramesorhizobium deserti TaxID=1494590 RepID=A0A135HZ16_9HYPH|nr:hypothetical protein ATN84_01290 [Paramesorhizobium deserti]
MKNKQTRQALRSPSGATRNKSSNRPVNIQGARNQYTRYTELARAEALNGNSVEAENYYQHAEHYYRCAAAERTTPAGS